MGIESAGAGIRTQKGFPPGDFKSPAVADFATPTNTPYCNDLRIRTLGAPNALGDDPGDKQVSGRSSAFPFYPPCTRWRKGTILGSPCSTTTLRTYDWAKYYGGPFFQSVAPRVHWASKDT